MTTPDLDHFKAFGFVVWRGLLSPEEAAEIEAELMQVMTEAFTDDPFDGTKRHWLPLLNARSPKIAALAEDARFYEKAQELVAGDVVLMVADGNRYVGESGWHPDGTPGSHGVKFFLYLGELTAGTGALRVVPGSHREPMYSEMGAYVRNNSAGMDDVPCYVFECKPGDVLALDYPMWHGSVGGSNDRRMCTIEYYRMTGEEDDRQEARNHFGAVVGATAQTFPDPGGFPFYDEAWLANPEASSVRARIIDDMRDAGLLEIAGVDTPVDRASGIDRSRQVGAVGLEPTTASL